MLPILAALAAVAIWGASPAATMLAAETIDPALIGGMRSVCAVLLLLPAITFFVKCFPREGRARVELVVAGITGFAAYPFALSIGVALTSVSHASLILAAAPVFTGLISFVMTSNWPKPIWWIGAGIAVFGVAVLITGRATNTGNPATVAGDLLVLVSVLFASLGYVFGGRTSARIGKWPATFWTLAVGALVLMPFLIPDALSFDWQAVSPRSGIGMGFLILFVTILGYALWLWALGAAGATRVAPLQFGQPFVGILLSVALFSEPVTGRLILAGVLTIGGVIACSRA